MEIRDEILNIPFKPWEHITYNTNRTVVRRQYGSTSVHNYDAVFETLKSYDRSQWKLGDIVRFGKGYNGRMGNRWESWFLNNNDLDEYLRKNKLYDRRIPAYARTQYAIVLARYKWTKYKGYSTFRDYGTFIMMLTGDKIGHIRKYYVTCPYEVIGAYPYTKMKYNVKPENLFHGAVVGESVKNFLENLMEKIT